MSGHLKAECLGLHESMVGGGGGGAAGVLVWCGVVSTGYHCLLTLVWWVALACRRGNRPFLSPVIIDLQSRMKYPGMHLQRFHSICLQLIINFQCTTCFRYLHEGHFSFSLDGHYQMSELCYKDQMHENPSSLLKV